MFKLENGSKVIATGNIVSLYIQYKKLLYIKGVKLITPKGTKVPFNLQYNRKLNEIIGEGIKAKIA